MLKITWGVPCLPSISRLNLPLHLPYSSCFYFSHRGGTKQRLCVCSDRLGEWICWMDVQVLVLLKEVYSAGPYPKHDLVVTQ